MKRFKVWVEIEEVDEQGDTVGNHSGLLDGASVFETDDLDDAVALGNLLQSMAWVGEIAEGGH